MNSYLLNKIVREISERERMEKKIECAVTALNCQIDVERSLEEKKAAELHFILHGGPYPQ